MHWLAVFYVVPITRADGSGRESRASVASHKLVWTSHLSLPLSVSVSGAGCEPACVCVCAHYCALKHIARRLNSCKESSHEGISHMHTHSPQTPPAPHKSTPIIACVCWRTHSSCMRHTCAHLYNARARACGCVDVCAPILCHQRFP